MLDRGFKNLFFGFLMFLPGLYLVLHDLPRTSSYLSQIKISGMPLVVGAICIILGCIGTAKGLAGVARTGDNAIDLAASSRGITVRGGHTIPWDSISDVTSITYHNHAAIQITGDRADLNRALVLHLTDPMDLPNVRSRGGSPRLKIKLIHYPAIDYMPLFTKTEAEIARRRIPITSETKTQEM